MSKKKAITVDVETAEELSKYLTEDYPKVVIINVYHEFWGNCKCFESLIGKFNDMPTNLNKVDWICCNYHLLESIEKLPDKMTFGSKPIYLFFVKGKCISHVDGLNYPKIMEAIKKSYEEMDKEV